MILKSLPRGSVAGIASTLRYIVDGSKSKDVITHNMRSEDIEGMTKELLLNESFRNTTRSNSVRYYHDIISFSPSDREKIKNEMLQEIANQYFTLRGKQGMYVSTIHESTQHIHLHILTSGVEYRSGKAFWISKQNFANLKKNLQGYYLQRFPELSQSAVNHGNARQQWQAKQKEHRTVLKEEIGEKVKAVFELSHNRQALISALQEAGLHHYERNGIPTGVMYEETKFRFSSLGVQEQFNELSSNDLEEKAALQEINSLRQSRTERNLNSRFAPENKYDNNDIEDEEIGR